MRFFVTALAMIATGAVAEAGTSAKDRTIAIGPWQIEASFVEQDKFDRCVMSRTTADGIEARITRDEGGLSLVMMSPRWKLDKGQKYAVEFAAGRVVWKADVAASTDSVQISLTDELFNKALRNANSNCSPPPCGMNFPVAKEAWM